MKTRVILRQDIPSLGMVGDVVEVAAGHARNYLLPRHLAFPYSEDAMRRVEKDRKIAEERRQALMAEFEVLSAKLSGVQLTFEEKVSEEGHLYGSVSAARIGQALAEQGLDIPERHIRLAEPIREVGEFEVPIHVHGDLETHIKVWVVAGQEAHT